MTRAAMKLSEEGVRQCHGPRLLAPLALNHVIEAQRPRLNPHLFAYFGLIPSTVLIGLVRHRRVRIEQCRITPP